MKNKTMKRINDRKKICEKKRKYDENQNQKGTYRGQKS